MTKQLPMLAVRLLGNIPRLEAVRAILQAREYHFDGAGTPSGGPRGEAIPLGARVLKLVSDYDSLEAAKVDPLHALATLQTHRGRYDPTLLAALVAGKTRAGTKRSSELALAEVRPGMVLASDVTSTTGVLLVPRGHEVTPSVLQRLRNFAGGTVCEPIAVFAPSGPQ